MAGYKGYSMSNNAVEAYCDGEMPKSKWTKTLIIEAIEEYLDEEKLVLSLDYKNMSKKELVEFLKISSWHHTSKQYNKTNFYSLDERYIKNNSTSKIAISHCVTFTWKIEDITPKSNIMIFEGHFDGKDFYEYDERDMSFDKMDLEMWSKNWNYIIEEINR